MTRTAPGAHAWLCTVAAVASSLFARGAAADGLALEWSAPAGCPSAAFIESEVTRIVGRPWGELESSWSKVSASVVPESERFRLHVDLITATGGASERSVSAASCTEASEAVVAILTTGIAPSDKRSGAEPSSPARPSRGRPEVADRERGAAAPGAVAVRPVLGANLGVDFGSLPAAAPFAQLMAGVELGPLAVLGFVGATGRVLGQVEGSTAGADMSLFMAGLLGCLRITETRVSPNVCAGIELGTLAARGFGTSAPRDDDAFWSATLARGALDYRIGGASTVSLGVTAVVPFRHLRVVLSPEEVHRTPSVAARPWLGLGVRFQ
jgi:hypothetical protein